MSVVLDLKPETEKALQEKAAKKGFEVKTYVEILIEKDIEVDSEKSFDEILAPIRKGFEESGMSEDEWLELFENEREAMWQEKHGAK